MGLSPGRGKTPDDWVVVIVIVDVASLPPGVILAGEKEHELLVGSPEQANVTDLSNGPWCGERVIV